VKEPEGIAQIALAGGIRPDQQGEIPQRQTGVSKVFESMQTEVLEHNRLLTSQRDGWYFIDSDVKPGKSLANFIVGRTR